MRNVGFCNYLMYEEENLMRKLFGTVSFYGILGLLLGVFYREYTKLSGFEGVTALGRLHTHALALGLLFFLILVVLEKNFSISDKKYFKMFYPVYNIGLLGLLATLTLRGILDINGSIMNGLNHIAGTFHFILGVGFLLFLMNLNQALKSEYR